MTNAKHTVAHTPTPFGSFYRTTAEGYPEMVITAANGCPVAVVSNHAEYKETCALLVSRANAHDAMREALEALAEECASGNLVFRGYIERATLEAAQAALKLAKGEA